jgi:hypothetical protein
LPSAGSAGYHVRFSTIQDLAATLRGALADQTVDQRIPTEEEDVTP